jgi:hypothetical protein
MRLSSQSRASTGGDVGLAAKDLHTVGGEKLEGGTLQEWGREGVARAVACVWVSVWVGKDQFCAYLIGPGAAEKLVTV